MKANDRLRFRTPIYGSDGKFKKFVFFNAIDGSPAITCSDGDVFKETEQCTGLKDKNGRLIYENDIVKITGDIMTIDPRYDNKLYVVNYSDLSFGFDMVGEEKGTLYGECWDYEVVGNIHEGVLEGQK